MRTRIFIHVMVKKKKNDGNESLCIFFIMVMRILFKKSLHIIVISIFFFW